MMTKFLKRLGQGSGADMMTQPCKELTSAEMVVVAGGYVGGYPVAPPNAVASTSTTSDLASGPQLYPTGYV